MVGVYVIPLCLVVTSILAALLLDKMYPNVSGSPVALRVLPTSENVALDPETAYDTLRQQPVSNTTPSGRQAWLLASIAPQQEPADYLLEIPSRYISRMMCWDGSTMNVIGTANRPASVSEKRMIQLGTSIVLGQLTNARQVLCYGTFTQSASINARLWSATDFHQAASRFDHGMGLLEGGLLTPAIFTLIIALITRQSTYALLAAWLIANLRLGAFAIGWDTQWLGYMLPSDAMPLIRHLTAAAYYLLTVSLLVRLLRASNYTGHPRLLWLTKWSAILLLAATALPGPWFWPVVSIVAIFGLISTFILLTRVWKQTRLAIWFWQVTSLAVAFSILIGLAGMLVFGDINDLDNIYTTMLLLVSSAAMVLALAERLRNVSSEQQRLQTELVTSYAITPIGMFTLDAQRRFVRMNPVLERMLDFTIARHPDARWTDYFPELDWDDLTSKTRANEDVEITAKKRHSSDNAHHFAIRAVAVDKTIEGSLQDITAHTALIEQLRVLAGKDPVTEALNQRSIESAVANCIATLGTNGPSSLARLNLSHFNNISNLFGYTTGDALLLQTRKKISSTLRIPYELGRVGSDEFAILFPGQSANQVEPVMQDLAQSVNSHLFAIAAHTMSVKVAIGLIDLSPDLNGPKEALFAAGRACRDALKDQRQVVTYERGSAELDEHREMLRLFDLLEAGQTPEGFHIELQPILSMQAPEQSWNFEVLLRVKDSQDKPLSPGRLIAAAEDIGTITTIDKWVFETTLAWLDEHKRHLSSVRLLSINVSGVSLNSDAFTEHLFRLLDRYKHLARRIVIEMTEGVALADLERTQVIIRRLQETGVRIGLDDFGAGYTSFSYLRNLKADLIKIDGTLIQNMLADPGNIAIVNTIIRLAHQLKMTCVAEWVEDIETLETLHKMGINYLQGFIISPSVSLETVLAAKSVTDLLVTVESRMFVDRIQKAAAARQGR